MANILTPILAYLTATLMGLGIYFIMAIVLGADMILALCLSLWVSSAVGFVIGIEVGGE